MEFRDPPKVRRSYTKQRYLSELTELTQNPGMWGLLESFDDPNRANSTRSNLKTALKKGRYNGLGEANFTFSVQKENDKWGLYGRAE